MNGTWSLLNGRRLVDTARSVYVAAARARRVDHVLRDLRALQQHARLGGVAAADHVHVEHRADPGALGGRQLRDVGLAAEQALLLAAEQDQPQVERGRVVGERPGQRRGARRCPSRCRRRRGRAPRAAGEVDRVEVRGDEHDVARPGCRRPAGRRSRCGSCPPPRGHRLRGDRVARVRQHRLRPRSPPRRTRRCRCGGCGARPASSRSATNASRDRRVEQRERRRGPARGVRPGRRDTVCGATDGRWPVRQPPWRCRRRRGGREHAVASGFVGGHGCGHRSRSTSSSTSIDAEVDHLSGDVGLHVVAGLLPRPGLGAGAAGRAVVEAPVAVEGQPLPPPRRRERVVLGPVHPDVARLLLVRPQPGPVGEFLHRTYWGRAAVRLRRAPAAPGRRRGRRTPSPRSGRENSRAACMRATWPSVNMTMVSSST